MTRNRPDCNGYLGVARDLGANLGIKVVAPAGDKAKKGAVRSLKVSITDKQRCARYNLTVMSGVVVTNSPDWIARRLTNSGMRPINNVVDASNLVLLELNQPTHAFDADKVSKGFKIRCARDQETLLTLDGQTRVLETTDLLICDGADTPIGLAGVMGGASTEISATTTSVALETAFLKHLELPPRRVALICGQRRHCVLNAESILTALTMLSAGSLGCCANRVQN